MEVQISRKDINQRWGITLKENYGTVYVAKLLESTPAGTSGLEVGDVITHVNGTNVKTHGKRQVLEIIRQLRSMSLKFKRPTDSSKKPPSEDNSVVFASSSIKSDSKTPPEIPRNKDGKIAKKRGRPVGSTKKDSKLMLVKPKTSQPIMKTMLEQIAQSSDSENEQNSNNDEVLLDIQPTRREKLKERKTSTSLKKPKKTRTPDIDPYLWHEENPYKQMKIGVAKNNGNTITINENNPLDHLAKCAEAELTKIAEDNEAKSKALEASLLEQEIVIDELKNARLEERRKIDEAHFKNKQLTKAYKALQLSSLSETEKLKEELTRERTKNAELQAKYNEMKEAQDSVCKELSKTRNDLQKALANSEENNQTRIKAVSKATELMLLLQSVEF